MSFFARWLGKPPSVSPPSPFDAGCRALDRGRIDEALALFATALSSAATDAELTAIHNKRGIAEIARGDRSAAVGAFVDALWAQPRNVAAIVNVGNLLLEDGAIDEAVAHYEYALLVDDDYPGAHLNLGIAYKRLGRRFEAVREFRRAARLESRLRRMRKPR